VTYRVRFEGHALVQLRGLPVEGVRRAAGPGGGAGGRALGRGRDAVGHDPAYRQVVFGSGWGLLTFHVDDGAELIRIFDPTWIG
jgi:hypothetical protein